MGFNLKNHPFAVEAHFEQSIVLTYAVPKEQLLRLLPPCLELDAYDDKWGFVAAALVRTKDLRPKGFPKWMGHDFTLIGYRIFVRYTDERGKRLRGLFILKSETDKRSMEFLGNVFTHYAYTTSDISTTQTTEGEEIVSVRSSFQMEIRNTTAEVPLPALSPFPDWKTARRFAGPLPYTFTYLPDTNQVLIIEGMRENWIPEPVSVGRHSFGFFHQLGLTEMTLANAFVLRGIDYVWKKGRLERWPK